MSFLFMNYLLTIKDMEMIYLIYKEKQVEKKVWNQSWNLWYLKK